MFFPLRNYFTLTLGYIKVTINPSLFSFDFSSETTGPIVTVFHMEPSWVEVQTVPVCWPRWPPCPFMLKKKFLLLQNQETRNQNIWYKPPGISYHICSNDDARLTIDLFMERSDLPPCIFIRAKFWKKMVDCPQELSSLTLGLCTSIKSWKIIFI